MPRVWMSRQASTRASQNPSLFRVSSNIFLRSRQGSDAHGRHVQYRTAVRPASTRWDCEGRWLSAGMHATPLQPPMCEKKAPRRMKHHPAPPKYPQLSSRPTTCFPEFPPAEREAANARSMKPMPVDLPSRLLRHRQAIVSSALAAVIVAAWAYLLRGAMMDMGDGLIMAMPPDWSLAYAGGAP